MKRFSAGMGLYIFLLIPSVVNWMESIMIVHMFLQLPLLIVSGVFVGKTMIRPFSRLFSNWNANGVPCIMIAVFMTTYWMLPRAMDEALSDPYVEWFKFVSLPLVGICIVDSWKKLNGIGKGFLFFNYLPMFGLMAWLYIDSPVQVCNYYLTTEQRVLGWGFAFITCCMIFYIIQYVFTDHLKKAD
ncbi:MAG TPA: hypothetical protein VK111_12735 [Virgibacillus sp.]|nr:hypothetical protein [Virgibacillus sp.]